MRKKNYLYLRNYNGMNEQLFKLYKSNSNNQYLDFNLYFLYIV